MSSFYFHLELETFVERDAGVFGDGEHLISDPSGGPIIG